MPIYAKKYAIWALSEMCQKCGNKRNMRQSHIHIKLTCIFRKIVRPFIFLGKSSCNWQLKIEFIVSSTKRSTTDLFQNDCKYLQNKHVPDVAYSLNVGIGHIYTRELTRRI